MGHPIGYYASAPRGTRDAEILAEIEEQIGSFSENLTRADKLALRAVLSMYLFYKESVIKEYTFKDAITDTLPDSDVSASDVIELLEGISLDAAEGLIAFLSAKLHFNCH